MSGPEAKADLEAEDYVGPGHNRWCENFGLPSGTGLDFPVSIALKRRAMINRPTGRTEDRFPEHRHDS